jgi:hypothetical protein
MSFVKNLGVEPRGDLSVITSMNICGTSFNDIDTVRTQQLQFAKEIGDWMTLFAPLYERLCTKREDMEAGMNCYFNVAAMMQMQSIATSILIEGLVMTNEMEYDKFNPQFRELVDLASLVVKLRERRKKGNFWAGGFWIDIGITPQLLVVVTRCREPIIRRRAVELLEGWYIEGSWDPRLIAKLGRFLMEVEEERAMTLNLRGHDECIVSERARTVFSRVCEDSEKRMILMQCLLRSNELGGAPVLKEKYIRL